MLVPVACRAQAAAAISTGGNVPQGISTHTDRNSASTSNASVSSTTTSTTTTTSVSSPTQQSFGSLVSIPRVNNSWRQLLSTLATLLAFLAIAIHPVAASTNADGSIDRYITAHYGIIGVLTILAGIFLCFIGFRLFKPMLFIVTWVFVGLIVYVIVVNCAPSGGYKHNDTVVLVVPLVCGLVAACLILFCIHIAVAIVGALAGLALAIYIIQWSGTGLSRTARIVLEVVLPIVGAILAQFLEKIAIIIFTAFIGAYAIMFGVDCFVQAGFTDTFGDALHGDLTKGDFDRNRNIEIELGCMIALFFLGMLCQFLISRNRTTPDLDSRVRRRFCPCC